VRYINFSDATVKASHDSTQPTTVNKSVYTTIPLISRSCDLFNFYIYILFNGQCLDQFEDHAVDLDQFEDHPVSTF
jgi:hypothetical protein